MRTVQCRFNVGSISVQCRFNVGSMSKPGLAGGGLYRIQSSVLCLYSHNNTKHSFCLWIGDAGLESEIL